MFLVLFAQWGEAATIALGGACLADVSSVQYEPMVGFGHNVVGNVFHQLFFDAVWGGAAFGNKAYAVAHAKDVCVNGHCAFAPYDRLYDVGCLAADAGKGYKLVECLGYLALKVAA